MVLLNNPSGSEVMLLRCMYLLNRMVKELTGSKEMCGVHKTPLSQDVSLKARRLDTRSMKTIDGKMIEHRRQRVG